MDSPLRCCCCCCCCFAQTRWFGGRSPRTLATTTSSLRAPTATTTLSPTNHRTALALHPPHLPRPPLLDFGQPPPPSLPLPPSPFPKQGAQVKCESCDAAFSAVYATHLLIHAEVSWQVQSSPGHWQDLEPSTTEKLELSYGVYMDLSRAPTQERASFRAPEFPLRLGSAGRPNYFFDMGARRPIFIFDMGARRDARVSSSTRGRRAPEFSFRHGGTRGARDSTLSRRLAAPEFRLRHGGTGDFQQDAGRLSLHFKTRSRGILTRVVPEFPRLNSLHF